MIHNSQKRKQSKYLLVDEWLNEIWYIHIMEYYSALSRKEVLFFASTWMNLEGIMLSEIGQSQKAVM